MDSLKETHFNFPGQTGFYKGKVRDVYTIDNKYLAMVVTDRISAFDVVLPEPVAQDRLGGVDVDPLAAQQGLDPGSPGHTEVAQPVLLAGLVGG